MVKRVAVSVEGTTEERFTKLVLVPHFQSINISLQPIQMGGDIRISRIHKELKKLVHGFDYVTTLYDFYGFSGKENSDTKQSLEEKILSGIDSDLKYKVIPYIQMHEFEGLLFSSPDRMEEVLQTPNIQRWAESVLKSFNNNPENINNSPQTAPSKRIIAQVTGYIKSTHGPDIAKNTGLKILREKCQSFNQWISSIENLK